MELIYVELSNDQVELILVPNDVELNNDRVDRVELIGGVDIGTKRCRIK